MNSTENVAEPNWVLFEDEHVLVVNKPAEIASQGRRGEDSVEERVRRRIDPNDPSGVFLGMPQRLDRPVTGVLIFAKTPKAARRLAEGFAERTVRKEYWAIVEGLPEPSEGFWDDWLLEERGTNKNPATKVVAEGTSKARNALTRYRRENIDPLVCHRSWLRLWPETGRRHQLRAQLAARGTPIVGDRKYGARQTFAVGIALHARRFTFTHPTLFESVTIIADPPSAWSGAGFEFDPTD